ncbi:MAG: hypothetical protein HY432_02845 [Candidatus Liptonbacteria bacterium]|nr:hypothetical protein [Candidatus Liptonbacteria bacterium]
MKKTLYIFVVLVVIVIGGGIYSWFYYSRGGSQNNSSSSPLPQSSSSSLPTPSSVSDTFPKGETISIGTMEGSVVVKNFYNTVADTDEGFAILQDEDDYQISYQRSTSKFYIYLRNAASQSKAESDLLNILSIGQNDACKLDVSVVIAGQSNETGLSFCPGRY